MSICTICKNKNSEENHCITCTRIRTILPSNYEQKDILEIEKILENIENKNMEKENLDKINSCLKDENTYLKLELNKHKIKTSAEVIDDTDYKIEYKKLQEQLANAIKTIKYLSSLL